MNQIKNKPLARAANSNVTSNGTDKPDITTSLPVTLEELEIQKLLTHLLPTSKQAIRFVEIVGAKPDSPTNKCNRGAGGVNLSDLAIKYNPRLIQGGYYLDCRKPEKPIKNNFGEDSGQQLWGLYRVLNKEAA